MSGIEASQPKIATPKPPLLIVSGPSGSGKSTVIRVLVASGDPPLRLSVSATTRPPRAGEKDGIDYYFWTSERFEQEVQAGAFLEWAEVYGRRYGTLRREVDEFRQRGVGVVLDIDVQGAAQVRRECPDHVSVFLLPPSPEVLEKRLRDRKTDSEATIQRRLAAARGEMAHAHDYDYQVINDDLDSTVAQLRAILRRHYERG